MTVIVLDTSVFISAVLGPKGASREALRLCLAKRCVPLMGAALFLEYEAVMEREHLFARCVLSKGEREALLDAFASVCRWTHIYYGWRPNLRDEADNHLVELAVAGSARAIVTKNVRDVRHGELKFPGLVVLTPNEFLKEEKSWQR